MRTTALFLALFLTTGVSQANQPAPADAMPNTPEEWVAYLSDFTRNAEMLVDPKKFVAAMNQLSEPAFLAAALSAMNDPDLYAKSMASAMDPKSYANYAKLMDPATFTAWMQAMLNPQFANAMFAVVSDPNKVMRWMAAPMDPKVTSTALNLLNPASYGNLATAPANPTYVNTMMAPLNPNWFGGWANTVLTPQTYGGWGTWMATPYGAVPAAAVPAPAR
jgi:hypothetical protein